MTTDIIIQSQLFASIPTTIILSLVIIILCAINIKSFKESSTEINNKLEELKEVNKMNLTNINNTLKQQVEQTKQYQTIVLNLLNKNHEETMTELKETTSSTSYVKKNLDNVLFRGVIKK